MSESSIKHVILWIWLLVIASVFIAVMVALKPVLFKSEKPVEEKPKPVEVKPVEPQPIDYSKLIGMWHDEAIFIIHGLPPKPHDFDDKSATPPTIETWTIKNLRIKLAVVNDKVIGVQLGSLDWTGKDPCAR